MGDGDDVQGGQDASDGSSAMPPGPLQRLRAGGFEYPVFISWPHKMEKLGTQMVVALAKALEDRFQNEGGAKVLLDQDRLKAGSYWDQTLRLGLCRSVVTIVFLLRTYFQSEYCRLEWAISESLQRVRVPSDSLRSTIIPILLAKNLELPSEVSSIQYTTEFQELLAAGKDVTTHDNWPRLVGELADQVYETIDIVCQSERDWPAEEEIAKKATPRKFTWTMRPPGAAGAGSSRGPAARPLFPSIVVEKPAA
jgi:hypothetical protein